jgi:UDP-glucose:(heptosyl)LPS alpha-1,3-glucosyltransferase
MRIALVCKNYIPTKGGLEQYTISLSRELQQRGHEVHVFANRWQPGPGIIFHYVPMVRFSSPGKNLSFAYFSRENLSRASFDVIQSMERIVYQDIFRASDGINPIQIRERYASPILRKLKAMGPRRLALTFLENRIFQGGGSKYVMANSQLVRNQIIQYYKVHPEKIVVIYNSVNRKRFHPKVKHIHGNTMRNAYNIRKDELLLLFVGNDFRRKGLKILLEAVALLKRSGLKLMVVGSDDASPYVRWASANGLASQVLFLGPQSDIEKFYAACDLFVLPTGYDAFANACLEAMACGVPVVTTSANGASEIIKNGKHGYVLTTRSSEELAHCINALISSKERGAMGKNAALVAERFTMDNYMTQLMSLYEKVRQSKTV